MTLPKRKRQNSHRAQKDRSCKAHLAWVRGFICAVSDPSCTNRIEAAHVRTGTDGGTGLKPSDSHVIPLCSLHHGEQHSIGERAFERRYGIDMKASADGLWASSPAGRKYRREESTND